MMLFILHENIISKLRVLSAGTPGPAVRPAVRPVRHIKHLTVRAAGAVFQSPPVILRRQIVNIFLLKSGSDTVLSPFLIPWGIFIPRKHGCGKMVRIKTKYLS